MPNLLKKISLIFILIFSFFAFRFLSPSPALATPQEFIKAVQKGNNLQWYLGGSSGMIATTANTLLVGIVGAYDDQGKLISSGAVQGTSYLMASLYQTKPASSVQYVAYVLNHSGLTKSAYAAGSGWNFLTIPKDSNMASPILALWTVSRNVVYLLFIVIFVAIGFMIMFRSKLNPQTVVNIQLALPNIVVSLILVTFSFAICGFIIDFVFLGHKLIDAIFFANTQSPLSNIMKVIRALTLPPAVPPASYYDAVTNLDILTAFLMPSGLWGGINIWTSLGSFISNMGGFIACMSSATSLSCSAYKNIVTALGGTAPTTFTITSAIIPLIFAFTLLGTALKIFFGLITKYVSLILSTIFSPFVFLLTAFPGKSGGIGNFLKTMLSAALAFPAIAFMFYLAFYFVSGTIGLQLEGLPPLNKTGSLLGSASFGGTAGAFGGALEALIALGILMATTQVPQAIDQMLEVKPGIAGAATPDVGSALHKIPIIGSFLG
ncbi:MAG: hypothetical protein U0946_02290 [Patescibacteria group bacterium]|nr:hypothetical protein [Patescibacteria group bacterium]